MPSRWPRPQGTRVSSARTPRPTRSRDPRTRECVGRGGHRSSAQFVDREFAAAVERPAEPVDHAAEQLRPDRDAERRSRSAPPACRVRCRQARPAASAACGRRGSRPPRSATAGCAAAVADQADLADLGLEAGRLDDQADQVADAAAAAGKIGRANRLSPRARRRLGVKRHRRSPVRRPHRRHAGRSWRHRASAAATSSRARLQLGGDA